MAWSDVDYEVSPDGRVVTVLQNKKTGQVHAVAGTPDDVADELFRLIELDPDWEQVGAPVPMPKNYLGDDPPRDEYHSPSFDQRERLFGIGELDPNYVPPKRPATQQFEEELQLRREVREDLKGFETGAPRTGRRAGPSTPDATVESAIRYRDRYKPPLVREMGDKEMAPLPWIRPDEPPKPLPAPHLEDHFEHHRPFESGWTSVDDETRAPIRQRAATGKG